MNYSTLLTRSTDFGTGTTRRRRRPTTRPTASSTRGRSTQAYPQRNERQLIFALMQMLWDRAEPDGYAQHMTDDPYAEHARRTRSCSWPATATTRWPTRGRGRGADGRREGAQARTCCARGATGSSTRGPGSTAINALPSDATSSVLTVWDGGSRPSPLGNVAQDNAKDDDPHEWVRRTVAARAMKSAFLSLDSRVVDTCDGFCDTDTKSATYARHRARPAASRSSRTPAHRLGSAAVRILFVCLGQHLPLADRGGRDAPPRCASAGSRTRSRSTARGPARWHVGAPPDERSTEAARRRGHRARGRGPAGAAAATSSDYDLIVAMDRSNLRDLLAARARRRGAGEGPAAARRRRRARPVLRRASAASTTCSTSSPRPASGCSTRSRPP